MLGARPLLNDAGNPMNEHERAVLFGTLAIITFILSWVHIIAEDHKNSHTMDKMFAWGLGIIFAFFVMSISNEMFKP